MSLPAVDTQSTDSVINAALAFAEDHPEAAPHISGLVAHTNAWRGQATRLATDRVLPGRRTG